MKNILLLVTLLLLSISNHAQPFFFDNEEATYYQNDTVWSISDSTYEMNYSQLGVNVKRRKVILNLIGKKSPNKDYFLRFRIIDRIFDEENNIYIYSLYQKPTNEVAELIFSNDFKDAELKVDWDDCTELFSLVIELKRNKDVLKKPKDDFKILPRYIKKQLKLQAKIESGMV
jgi:hypothetical protein